jgi:hypothetical protein
MQQRSSTILAARDELPGALALLAAPVVLAGDDAAPVGRLRGAIVTESRRVLFLLLEPTPASAAHPGHVPIPLDAIEIGHRWVPDPAGAARSSPIVRVLWSREQLDAQPRMLDASHLPHVPEGDPVPPAPGANRPEGVRDALLAAGLSGGLGVVIGLLAGGPLVAVTLGLFFAAGGGIAGAVGGASRDSAADAAMGMPPLVRSPAGLLPVRELEEVLRAREPYDAGLLTLTPIAVEVPPRTGRRPPRADDSRHAGMGGVR